MFLATGQRILIIDSDNQERTIMAQLLSQETFNVFEANNAEDGLSLAFRLYPDAIITAEWMTGLSGSELIGQVRSDPLLRHTPIILLAEFNSRLLESQEELGRADEYMPEPFTMDDLLRSLKRLLSRKPAKATGSWLKGDLRGFGLEDVLTMVQQNRLTGLLKVSDPQVGLKFQFLFDRGSLVWVVGPGIVGIKALFRAMRLENGRFMFHAWDQFQRKPWHEEMRINNLLLGAVQEKDELPLLLKQLPSEGLPLSLAEDIDLEAVKDRDVLKPLLLGTLEAADIRALIDASPETDLDAAQDIQKLLSEGILVAP